VLEQNEAVGGQLLSYTIQSTTTSVLRANMVRDCANAFIEQTATVISIFWTTVDDRQRRLESETRCLKMVRSAIDPIIIAKTDCRRRRLAFPEKLNSAVAA